MSFSSDLDKFEKLVSKRQDLIYRSSAFDLFSAIISETPVDKGVLRNNWYAQIGSGSTEVTSRSGAAGNAATSRMKAVVDSGSIQDDIYFTNNLPYSVPIEYNGHSGKAPQGMVRVNTVRWGSIVTRNARKYSNAR